MKNGLIVCFVFGLSILGCNQKESNSQIGPPRKIHKPDIKLINDSNLNLSRFDSIQLIQFYTANCKQFEPDFDSIRNEIYYYKTKILPQKSIHLIDSLFKQSDRKNTGPESTCQMGYQFIGYLKGEVFDILAIDDCDMTKHGYLSREGRKTLAKICSDCELTYKPCWSDRYYSK